MGRVGIWQSSARRLFTKPEPPESMRPESGLKSVVSREVTNIYTMLDISAPVDVTASTMCLL